MEYKYLETFALKTLSRREYSRLELRRRLIDKGGDPEDIENLLNDFEKKGWLNEDRFVEVLIRSRRNRFGCLKILRELEEKGVSDSGISLAKELLSRDEELIAKTIWKKKFGVLPVSLSERGRQARFMQSRGFDQSLVRRILGGED
ncbi:MAG: recombination regulator RecX [Burkholderiales bacterium]